MRFKRITAVVFAGSLLAGMTAPQAMAQSNDEDIFNGGRGSSVSQLPSLPEGSAIGSIGGDELTQIEQLDPEQYAGSWYQVAAVPQPYTLQCLSNTKAEYEVIDDATISVKNSCTTLFGTTSDITGKAQVKDPETNASLRVAFDGIPGQSLEGETNYRVTYLSEDYDLAIVGDPQRRSGFVLSRTPNLSAEDWNLVKTTVTERGWWDCAFFTTPHEGGESVALPLCTK